jgi:uncharacterized protein YgiM (DUF1202 family)
MLTLEKVQAIKYQSLGVIPVGEKIQVLESSGKWTKIYYRGTEGYISSKFISSNNGGSYQQ